MTIQAPTQGRYAVINTLLNITDVTLIESMNGRQGDNGRLVYFAIKDGSLPHNLSNQEVRIVAKDNQGKIKIISGVKDMVSATAGLISMVMPAELYQASGDIEEGYLQITDISGTVVSSVPITFTVVANNILMTANASKDYIDTIQAVMDQANKLIKGLSNNIEAQQLAYQSLNTALEVLTGQINDKQVALTNIDNIYTGYNRFKDITSFDKPIKGSLEVQTLPTTTSLDTVVTSGTYKLNGNVINVVGFDSSVYQHLIGTLNGVVGEFYRQQVTGIWNKWTQLKNVELLKENYIQLLGDAYITFKETESGVQATLKGTITSDSVWHWVDTGFKIPDNISTPISTTVIHSPLQSGVENISDRIPAIFSIMINTDRTIMYRLETFDSNNWLIRNGMTGPVDGSAFWIKSR